MSPIPHPRMLYGTAWKTTRTRDLVVQAVLTGFTGIDTACQPKHYRQKLVGEALAELREKHGILREKLWVQTKFTSLDGQDLNQPLPYDKAAPLAEQVRQSFATSLKELQTDYVDALILHGPLNTLEGNLTVWSEFEKLVKTGRVRYIGLSNLYRPKDLELLRHLFAQAEIKPTILQNHLHSNTAYSIDFLDLLSQHPSTIFQSFWTLTGNPRLLASPALLHLAKTQNLTPEQAFFKFLMKLDRWENVRIVPLSGTTNEGHMKEDVEVTRRAEEEEELDSEPQVKAEELAAMMWGL